MSSAPAVTSAGPRILVVEDEAVVSLDLQKQLTSLGYQVVDRVATGEQAVLRATEEVPDLVLLDIHLRSSMTGLDVAAQLQTSGIPIVFLTAFADEDTIRQAQELSPYGYIVKPFTREDLRAAVAIALRRHRETASIETSRQQLLSILDAQRSGSLVVDDQGGIAFMNRAAREIFDVEQAAAIGDLPLAPETIEMLRKATPGKLGKLQATTTSKVGQRTVEVEVVEDPQNSIQRIFFVYDVTDVTVLRHKLDRGDLFEDMIGRDPTMLEVFRSVEVLARVETSVLILGETGTGKELVARALHNRSDRVKGPFVAVNCGSVTTELASSLLFGHRKGAFTGAIYDHVGYFEQASGGTLFLDEIGELSAQVQSSLLRLLENRVVVRLGDHQEIPVDVRLLAATHRDLVADQGSGRFRADLYYRLRAAQINLPPLRQRGTDVVLFASSFLAETRARMASEARDWSKEALDALIDYSWPGNIREFKNAVEFSVLRATGATIELADLPPEISASTPVRAPQDERKQILDAIADADGNRKQAATRLGMSRATFYRRLKKFEIDG